MGSPPISHPALADLLIRNMALSPADLAALTGFLRASGFPVGAGQALAAEKLLWRMAEQGVSKPASDLAPWLAPIFCTTPDEQQKFPGLYTTWSHKGTGRTVIVDPPVPVAKPRWRRYALVAIVFSGLAAAGAAWWIWRPTPKPQPSPPPPVVETTPQTVPAGTTKLPPPPPVPATATASVKLLGYPDQNAYDLQQRGTPVTGAAVRIQGRLVQPDSSGVYQVTGPHGQPVLVTHCDYDAALFPLEGSSNLTVRMVKKPYTGCTGPPPTQKPSTANNFMTRYSQELRIAAAALPLFLFLCYWIYIIWRRVGLRKLRGLRAPVLTPLAARNSTARVFREVELQRAVQEMRRAKAIPLMELWPERSVTATVENAGWFTPVYSPRHATPEYLVLIDRSARRDQQARFCDELVARLEDRRVPVEVFHFKGDPRTCIHATTGDRHTLVELSARYGSSVVLILGDGREFFASFTGRLERWVDIFDQWPARILLTPTPSIEWSGRERQFLIRGFEVLSGDFHGLARVMELANPAADRDAALPPSLEYRPHRWTGEEPVSPQEIARLSSELRLYLGRSGYRWLAACALYPVCEWGVTLAFGERLATHEEFPRVLRKLIRLPWMRSGTIPEWLRAHFLAGMAPDFRAQALTILQEFLKQPQPAAGQASVVAQPVAGSRATPTDAAAEDEVMLAFLWGSNPLDTVLKKPGRLRRILFSKGNPWHGLNPWVPAAVLALSLVGLAFTAPRTVPGPSVNPLPRIVLDIAASQVHDASYFNAAKGRDFTGPLFDLFGTTQGTAFAGWCYWMAALVLNQPDPLQLARPPETTDPQGGDIAIDYKADHRSGIAHMYEYPCCVLTPSAGEVISLPAGTGTTKFLAPEPVKAGQPPSTIPRFPTTLLWVDDNPDNNRYHADYFRGIGYVVERVLSTEDAVRRLSENDAAHYWAVISDMTRGTTTDAGMQLLTTIRNSGNQVPFYVYTTSAEATQWRDQVLQRGGSGATSDFGDLETWVEGRLKQAPVAAAPPKPSVVQPSIPPAPDFSKAVAVPLDAILRLPFPKDRPKPGIRPRPSPNGAYLFQEGDIVSVSGYLNGLKLELNGDVTEYVSQLCDSPATAALAADRNCLTLRIPEATQYSDARSVLGKLLKNQDLEYQTSLFTIIGQLFLNYSRLDAKGEVLPEQGFSRQSRTIWELYPAGKVFRAPSPKQ